MEKAGNTKNETEQYFLTDGEISNLLWSCNISDIEFLSHLSRETRNDICHFQEVELKGNESGYIFNIGIYTLLCAPSWWIVKELVSWAEKDYHFSFIIYDQQCKEEDELKEISDRLREKNASGAKIFLAKMRPYRLYNSPHAGKSFLLREGLLYDLENNLVNMDFNRTIGEREFWRLFPPKLFEINSKSPRGLEEDFFFFPLENGLLLTSGWSKEGIWITLEGDNYNDLVTLYNFGLMNFQNVFPSGAISFFRRRGLLYCRINNISLKDFVLSNSNGRRGIMDFMITEREKFTDWVRGQEIAIGKTFKQKELTTTL